MLASYNSGSYRLELAEALASANILRLPSPLFPPVGKKTTLVRKCQTPIIARNFFHANAKKCSASEAMPSCTNAKPDFISSFLSASKASAWRSGYPFGLPQPNRSQLSLKKAQTKRTWWSP